ncbi:MAG: sodium-dependent transporter [Desulfovibrio sp.]|uniref:sodium-dependent transporter n=1 Tax=Desulfovibrio sp. 7SRBS1 TaxID=3378064 RepID=UPI003B3EC41E
MQSGNTTAQPSRDGFATGLGVLAATLGSAVGLGNIWKFPYLTGSNGGATFLFVYLACTVLVGLPVMISELMLGRAAQADAVTTYQRLGGNKGAWGIIGVSGVLASCLILAFYTDVAGWVFAYIFKAMSGSIVSTDPNTTSAAFNSMVSNPIQSLVWQWIVLAVVATIIIMGVSKGIEKTTKRLMPVLFLLLIIICVRSLTLPGASKGLAFLFSPDLSKINGTAVLIAMGLAFFKLSIGTSTMTTYGSYFRRDQNIPLTATRVVLADLTVSLLAGIAIFPAVFAFGFKPDAGPSLLFITIPAVFASMPMGRIFVVIFFVLTAIASTGAMLSLFEVPVAYLAERHGMSRLKASVMCAVGLALFGAPSTLSSNLMADFKIFGLNMFDLCDFVSSNLLMPIGGLFICFFAAWIFGKDRIVEALSNRGALSNQGISRVYTLLVAFLTPILVIIVLLNGLGVF